MPGQQARILAFSGSLRKESLNQKLVEFAAQAAHQAGAEVKVIALRDLPLPVFDEDLEAAQGLPENVLKLKSLLKAHDGFLIASPEYNSAPSAALKNMIDWASRPAPKESPLECFRGKTAGIMATSPGALGGLRGLPFLRLILSNIGVYVIPEQHAMCIAHEKFDDSGALINDADATIIRNISAQLTKFTTNMLDN